MKIKIQSKRDGGGIYLNDTRVGYIEAYSGVCFVRFATATVTEDGPLGYGNTEAIARCKWGKPYTDAKRFAREALKAAGGNYTELARRAADGTWGDRLVESFA